MKIIFFSLGVFIVFLTIASNTFACSCGMRELENPDDLRREMSRYGAVFSGQVVEIRQVSKYIQDVKFRLDKSWRGASSETITVAIETYTNCSYPFEVGQSYLVFAYASAKIPLATSLCSRTAKIEDAAELLDFLNYKFDDVNAHLSGTIHDENRNALKETLIRVKSQSGKIYEAVTDIEGVYSFDIPTGIYSIEVISKEFEPFRIRNYRVVYLYKSRQVFDLELKRVKS